MGQTRWQATCGTGSVLAREAAAGWVPSVPQGPLPFPATAAIPGQSLAFVRPVRWPAPPLQTWGWKGKLTGAHVLSPHGESKADTSQS